MKTKPTLVGTDRAVHLDSKAAIELNVTLVVHPRHSEQDDALGLDDALENFRAPVFGVFLEDDDEGFGDLFDGLMELGLGRVLRDDIGHEGLHVVVHRVGFL